MTAINSQVTDLGTVFQGVLMTVQAAFTTNAGDPIDPTDIYLVFGPSGPRTQWQYGGAGSIERTGLGLYVAGIDTSPAEGRWTGYWEGTGDCKVPQPFSFVVTGI